jgi:hypothetical protein
MDFRSDAGTEKLRDSPLAFMDEKIYPAEPVFAEQMASLSNRWAWTQTPIMGELRAEAARGGNLPVDRAANMLPGVAVTSAKSRPAGPDRPRR